MSENIERVTAKLDGLLIENGNGDLGHVNGNSSSGLDLDALDELLEQSVIVSGKRSTSGTKFASRTITYQINLGVLLKKVSPITMSVIDYQREKREIGAKEMGELHQVVCETGQTDLVPFTLCLIEPLIEGIDIRISELRQSGEDHHLEDLLSERSTRYKGYIEEGYSFFIIDGQTRLHNYEKYYNESSRLKIKYPDSTADKFYVMSGKDREYFTLNDRTFESLSERQKKVFYEGLPIEVKIISTTDYKTPASAFKVMNSGLPVRPSLSAMNNSFNGLRNQIEIGNLRKDSEIYGELIDQNHEVFERNFYGGQQTQLFGKISKGIQAFSYLELVYLFGDEMNDPTASKLKGSVLFGEGKENGFTGIVNGPMANPSSVLKESAFHDWVNIRSGMSNAMDSLERDGTVFSYETSTKVNGVYFTGMLKDMEYSKYDWKNLFREYLQWNYHKRIETRYVKVSAVHLQTGDLRYTDEDIGMTDYTDPKKKDKIERSEGYCFWGKDQITNKALQGRKNELQQFINNNIEEWKKEGYLV